MDRRVVVNPDQAHVLLEAVGTVQRSGPHLAAFLGCLYYSALRPEEAAHPRPEHLELPNGECLGWINLEHAGPEIDRQWTDLDSRRGLANSSTARWGRGGGLRLRRNSWRCSAITLASSGSMARGCCSVVSEERRYPDTPTDGRGTWLELGL